MEQCGGSVSFWLQNILDNWLTVFKKNNYLYVIASQEPEPAQRKNSRSRLKSGWLQNPGDKFWAFNLAGEIVKFLRTLITNQKYKLGVY